MTAIPKLLLGLALTLAVRVGAQSETVARRQIPTDISGHAAVTPDSVLWANHCEVIRYDTPFDGDHSLEAATVAEQASCRFLIAIREKLYAPVSSLLCLQAGAKFITSDGIDLDVVPFAVKENGVVCPGALTPTDVITARKAGSHFGQIVPSGHVGGDSYIKALKAMFPSVPLIAAGGVNQKTAYGFILAGATALGIGKELVSGEGYSLATGRADSYLVGSLPEACERCAQPKSGKMICSSTRTRSGFLQLALPQLPSESIC